MLSANCTLVDLHLNWHKEAVDSKVREGSSQGWHEDAVLHEGTCKGTGPRRELQAEDKKCKGWVETSCLFQK